MAHPGIKGGGKRSLRTIALEKGTNPQGFGELAKLSSDGSYPLTPQVADNEYVEQKPLAVEGPNKLQKPPTFTVGK